MNLLEVEERRKARGKKKSKMAGLNVKLVVGAKEYTTEILKKTARSKSINVDLSLRNFGRSKGGATWG